jgi:septum formation protein
LTIPDILKYKYVLASKSPRRINLLKQIGLDFIAIDSEAEEWDSNDFKPVMITKINTGRKVNAVIGKAKGRIIISADTIVAVNKKILHKPSSVKDAKNYLKILSGKKHTVYTGVLVVNPVKKKTCFDYEKTDVYFRKLNSTEINYYIKNYNPLDKAGSYGIQDDFGCLFIEKINGDFYNVVGLPLAKLSDMILKVIK